jgi:hypothetical protein
MSAEQEVSDLDAYWHELVTTALLGTDRRDPPAPPAGPVADLIDDALRPDGASRMLAAVGAVSAVRRAAFVAGPVADPLQPSASDDRLCCSAQAVATWRTVVAEWPVLEDEWLLTVIESGMRVPPDALVELLQRHRGDAVRRARVALAGGPLAGWLTEHLPSLEPTTRSSASAEAVASLPELPVSPELAHLVVADAHTFVRRIAQGFDGLEFGPPHRAVLVNLFARCRPEVLPNAASTFGRADAGLALVLADLAALRHRMLTELGVIA